MKKTYIQPAIYCVETSRCEIICTSIGIVNEARNSMSGDSKSRTIFDDTTFDDLEGDEW